MSKLLFSKVLSYKDDLTFDPHSSYNPPPHLLLLIPVFDKYTPKQFTRRLDFYYGVSGATFSNSSSKVHKKTLSCNFWYDVRLNQSIGWGWAELEKIGLETRNTCFLSDAAQPEPLNWFPSILCQNALCSVVKFAPWPRVWDFAPDWSRSSISAYFFFK